MTATPASRSLPMVLRRLLDQPTPTRLLVGEVGPVLPDPTANAYVNVIYRGETLTVPKLAGASVTVGAPAYMLATRDGLVYVGAVTTTPPTGGVVGPPGPKGDTGPAGPAGPQGTPGASTFISGTGAPSAATGVDGSIYLDTASGRVWGPKAAGAWPGAAFGRLMPLQPTYAQLKAG